MHLPWYQLGIFELAQVMAQQMACLLVDYKSSTTLIRDPEVVLHGLPFLSLLVHVHGLLVHGPLLVHGLYFLSHFVYERLGHELGYDHEERLHLMVKNCN